jgi:hypothetical protein
MFLYCGARRRRESNHGTVKMLCLEEGGKRPLQRDPEAGLEDSPQGNVKKQEKAETSMETRCACRTLVVSRRP